MATERDSRRIANANCVIASEFKRLWQDCENAQTPTRLHARLLFACRTKAVRRELEIDVHHQLRSAGRRTEVARLSMVR
jgi:hypothetical protein